ncbi:phage tail protein [Francisella philomiragia]|uniref:Phage tail protein n=1 Tax=Francisella philomiragia TaxID=28110 RepID=A0ABS1GCZ9_9GAMM|nr:phage tail protein [Francisella philomiragia]MBK2258986.1 phage tail protein [Francisella philomiragia]MBK2302677.1 phage tail protein [Francisella philomiragia]
MITISANQVNSVAQAITGLDLDDKDIRRAFHQALGRSVTKAKSRIARDIAKECNIPLKAVRRRVFLFKEKHSNKSIYTTKTTKMVEMGVIWIGLNDIAYSHFGKARQAGDDVIVAGKYKVQDAEIFDEYNRRKLTKSEKRKEGIDKSTRTYRDFSYQKIVDVFSGKEAMYSIDDKARALANNLLPYYVQDEFNENFERILRYVFKK